MNWAARVGLVICSIFLGVPAIFAGQVANRPPMRLWRPCSLQSAADIGIAPGGLEKFYRGDLYSPSVYLPTLSAEQILFDDRNCDTYVREYFELVSREFKVLPRLYYFDDKRRPNAFAMPTTEGEPNDYPARYV